MLHPRSFISLATSWQAAALYITAVIAYYGWFLYQQAMNIPMADDITDVLGVISGILQARDGDTVLALLFEQHNDHRTLSSRLVFYAIYLVEGEVNFRTLTFAANLALPLLLGLLFFAIPDRKNRCWVLLPAALLLFQLRAYGITLWAMAAFAYFFVYAYGIASLYCLQRLTRVKFAAAVLFAFMSTFTLASGQLIWLVGFASVFQQAVILKRISLVYIPCWLIAAVLVLSLWRLGLETPNDLLTLLGYFLQTPAHHISYFLTLLGSAVSSESIVTAWLTGTAMLVVLILLTLRHYRRDELRLELVCWFIVFSTAAMVLGRAPYSTVEYALSSRYSFPSVIMLTSSWVLVATRLEIKRPRVLLAVVLLAGIFCSASYVVYSRELQPYLERRVQNFNRGNYWIFGRPLKESNAIAAEAIALGIYHPPPRPYRAPKLAPTRQAGKSTRSNEKP